MTEETIDPRLQEKLDYCQQCHLHKNECRCEATLGVAKPVVHEPVQTAKVYKIMLSDWTISLKGEKKIVKDIIVKDLGKDRIAKEETFLNRVRREIKTSEKFEVLDIAFTMDLGETNCA